MTSPAMSTAPVSGDPEQVRRISAQLAAVQARALQVESRLRAIESGVGPQMWRGRAADSFTGLLAETGPDLTRLAISYGAASQALATYATELAAAQDTARAAQAEASTATADRDRATADRDTARSDADRHAAAASDAQQRLDPAAAQDAEQRRADAVERGNAARAAIGQAEQDLQAARQKADQAASQRDAAAARCVRELDDASGARINTRNLARTPAAADGPPPAAPAESNQLADIGHTILDVVGLVPVVGEAADAVNAAWYTAEGDYANAALSAAAIIPGIGAAATAAKLAAKGSDIARGVDNAPGPHTVKGGSTPRATPDHDGQPTGGVPQQTESGHDGHLEGQTEIMVNDPAVTGRTITDIDRVEEGVLWEEKSATTAQDVDKWVRKHIDRKFQSYLEARQHLEGYENAPIGFRFTKPGADPGFKAAVEKVVDDLRATNPDVDIRLDWGE